MLSEIVRDENRNWLEPNSTAHRYMRDQRVQSAVRACDSYGQPSRQHIASAHVIFMEASPMRTAISLLMLMSFSVAAPALAQGRGGDKGGNQGNAQNSDQGQGQGQGKGQGKGQGQGGQSQGQGQGQSQNQGQQGQGQGNSQAGTQHGNVVVADRDRSAVQTYYRDQFATGNCPPGLAKKNNGCLPPGQAKKLWAIGQPLPPSLVYYALPGVLLTQLTPPPMGYQYVRVDNDVLLMVVATRMIANVVANLGG